MDFDEEVWRVWKWAIVEAVELATLKLRHDLTEIAKQNERIEKLMSAIDDKIAALTAEVARNTTTEKSALALITGFGARLADAIAAATSAGATPTQLKALNDLNDALGANDTELAAAVAANTPPAPVPAPAPAPTPTP